MFEGESLGLTSRLEVGCGLLTEAVQSNIEKQVGLRTTSRAGQQRCPVFVAVKTRHRSVGPYRRRDSLVREVVAYCWSVEDSLSKPRELGNVDRSGTIVYRNNLPSVGLGAHDQEFATQQVSA